MFQSLLGGGIKYGITAFFLSSEKKRKRHENRMRHFIQLEARFEQIAKTPFGRSRAFPNGSMRTCSDTDAAQMRKAPGFLEIIIDLPIGFPINNIISHRASNGTFQILCGLEPVLEGWCGL